MCWLLIPDWSGRFYSPDLYCDLLHHTLRGVFVPRFSIIPSDICHGILGGCSFQMNLAIELFIPSDLGAVYRMYFNLQIKI